MDVHGIPLNGEENKKQDMEIKTLTLHFPMGESVKICDKIARFAEKVSNYSCSGGGFAIKRFPLEQGDENMEFEEDEMSYTYDYEKE